MARGSQPFGQAWMNRTFDDLYNGYAEKVVRWTNGLLFPPPEYIVSMMGAAQGISRPGLAPGQRWRPDRLRRILVRPRRQPARHRSSGAEGTAA